MSISVLIRQQVSIISSTPLPPPKRQQEKSFKHYFPPPSNQVQNTSPQKPSPTRTTRANPFPKVTGLFCRIPLPALFILSRVFETWGPDAVIGTSRHGLSATPKKIFLEYDYHGRTRFQGPSSALRTVHKTHRSSSKTVFLNITFFHTSPWKFKQKRQLCPKRSPACSPPPIQCLCHHFARVRAPEC